VCSPACAGRGRRVCPGARTEVLVRKPPSPPHVEAAALPVVGLTAWQGLVDFTGAVRDIDVVLDTIGGDTVERSLEVLCPGGHLVTAVAEDDPVPAAPGGASAAGSAADAQAPVEKRK